MNGAKTEYQQCNGSKAFSNYFIIANALKLIHRTIDFRNGSHHGMTLNQTKQANKASLHTAAGIYSLCFAIAIRGTKHHLMVN
jgi:hypothetical protein